MKILLQKLTNLKFFTNFDKVLSALILIFVIFYKKIIMLVIKKAELIILVKIFMKIVFKDNINAL